MHIKTLEILATTNIEMIGISSSCRRDDDEREMTPIKIRIKIT